jgi:hypothetical protein
MVPLCPNRRDLVHRTGDPLAWTAVWFEVPACGMFVEASARTESPAMPSPRRGGNENQRGPVSPAAQQGGGPQRTIPRQPRRQVLGGIPEHTLLSDRPRAANDREVLVELKPRIVHPDRSTAPERHVDEPLTQPRNRDQPVLQHLRQPHGIEMVTTSSSSTAPTCIGVSCRSATSDLTSSPLARSITSSCPIFITSVS